jgi:Mg2+/Co2+ transporter CorB
LHLSREGGRKAAKVQKALSNMARTTTTLLIGNNIMNVGYSSATAALSTALFGDNSNLVMLWSFMVSFILLYNSEFMPKMLCAARPLRRILMLADVYEVLSLILSPLTALAMKFTDIFLPRREQKYSLTSADLLRILQDRKDGVCLSDFESALITRIFVLRAKGKPITREAILEALS